MMRVEIAQFEEITGEKGWNTPIGEIRRFLDGYERGCDKTIDRVLEIIDAEVWNYCDYIIKHGNLNAYKQNAACYLSEHIRKAVMKLKGGEHG